MEKFEIVAVEAQSFAELSAMVGELLEEIMRKIGAQVFNFDRETTEIRARELCSRGIYWVFVAREMTAGDHIGFVSLYESYALYSEGPYGTIPELYVRPNWRSLQVGRMLLDRVEQFSRDRGWRRVEVTTPPLPEFDRTLRFYQSNGFEISGGRKLKLDVAAV